MQTKGTSRDTLSHHILLIEYKYSLRSGPKVNILKAHKNMVDDMCNTIADEEQCRPNVSFGNYYY